MRPAELADDRLGGQRLRGHEVAPRLVRPAVKPRSHLIRLTACAVARDAQHMDTTSVAASRLTTRQADHLGDEAARTGIGRVRAEFSLKTLAVAAFAAIAMTVSVLLPSSANAATCKPVHGYSTMRAIHTHNAVSCRTARRLLARWMRVGYPEDSYGRWYCQWTRRAHRVDGLCSGGNGGDAPYFTFHRYDPDE